MMILSIYLGFYSFCFAFFLVYVVQLLLSSFMYEFPIFDYVGIDVWIGCQGGKRCNENLEIGSCPTRSIFLSGSNVDRLLVLYVFHLRLRPCNQISYLTRKSQSHVSNF